MRPSYVGLDCSCCGRGPMGSRSRPPAPVRVGGHGLCDGCYRNDLRAHRCKHTIDDVVLDRIVAGVPTSSTRAERFSVTEYGVRHGWSVTLTAERLRVTPRTVLRYRALLRRRDG